MQRQSESAALAVPAGAKQGADTRERDWSWVEASVWTERMLTALREGVRGGKWYSLMDKVYRAQTLQAAWERVEGNGGASGVDGQSVVRFAARAPEYLEEVGAALKERRYRPEAVRRVEIDKGHGKRRPLGIPTVKDRIVQTALKYVLEPIFEQQFLPMSYGFRPGRGCKEALGEVDRWVEDGYTQVVDADLASYFDSIPRAGMMARVREHIQDGAVLELIEAYLSQDVLRGLERWTPTSGTPQGAVISPLLANLYLHPLDVHMTEHGYRMVRYADDFVVLCRTGKEAQAALVQVRAWVQANGLSLNEQKTHVGDCREAGQGFEFLGYRFEAGRRGIRRKSLQALRDKVRARTGRNCGQSLRSIIAELNPMLRGWFGYFKHANPNVFRSLDGFIRRRLRAVLRTQSHRPGRGRTLNDHCRWPNAFFATQGLFTLVTAHAMARQSR